MVAEAGGGLFNEGAFGNGSTWIGQIADDSTWRDNINAGKFESKQGVPGWGYRYKVRIMGIHDQSTDKISSEELPWAALKYGVTDGGGQTNASKTPNIRQGMFVYGFWQDGPGQQVPIIDGILGNNTQTALSMKTENTGSRPFEPRSGFSQSEKPKREAKEMVPDEGLSISAPTDADVEADKAAATPTVAVDKYGLPKNLPRTPAQIADVTKALRDVEEKKINWVEKLDGISDAEIQKAVDDYVANEVKKGVKNRVAQKTGPNQPATGAPTTEDESIHLVTAGDVRREEKYQEKVPLMKPDDKVQSALKNMQTVMDNLSKKLDKGLKSYGSYLETATKPDMNFGALFEKAAADQSKYMKVLTNKMREYTQKKLGEELTKTVSSMPASKRHMFGDMKNVIAQNALKQYDGIAKGLAGNIGGVLKQQFDLDGLVKKAQAAVAKSPIPPSDPFAASMNWLPVENVPTNEIIKSGNNYYRATQGGTTSGVRPTHTSGSQRNGNSTLTWIGSASGTPAVGIQAPSTTTSSINMAGTITKVVNVGGISTTTIIPGPTFPQVPICSAEKMVGQVLAMNREAIDTANNNVINGINTFLEEIKKEIEEVAVQNKPKALDVSRQGEVLSLTEEYRKQRGGGSYYVSGVAVPATVVGSIMAGIGSTSTETGGSGLTVDITVSVGGMTGNTDAFEWIELLTNGSGYQVSLPVTGLNGTGSTTGQSTSATSGSGSGGEVSFDIVGGEVTRVSVVPGDGGSNYRVGDIFEINNTHGSTTKATCKIVKPRGRIDRMTDNPPGIIINNPGKGYKIGDSIQVWREEYNGVGPDSESITTQTMDAGHTPQLPIPTEGPNKPQALSSMMSMLGSLSSSLASALTFTDTVSNLFPFEEEPNKAVSDFYNFARGGSGLPDAQLPSAKAVGEEASQVPPDITPDEPTPFVQPPADAPTVDLKSSDVTSVDMDAGYDDPDYNPDDYLELA